jgi:hypothetical protein
MSLVALSDIYVLDAYIPFKSIRSEVCILRALKHPNIVEYRGVLRDWGTSSFAMISTWMVNHTVVKFLEANPEHNRARLVIPVFLV